MVGLALAGVVAWLWLRSRKGGGNSAGDSTTDPGPAVTPSVFHTAEGNAVLVTPGDLVPDGSGAIFQPVIVEPRVAIDNGAGDTVYVTKSGLQAATDGASSYNPFTADSQARVAEAKARDAELARLAAEKGFADAAAMAKARADEQAAADAAEWKAILARNVPTPVAPPEPIASAPIAPVASAPIPLGKSVFAAAGANAAAASAAAAKAAAAAVAAHNNQGNYAILATAGPSIFNKQPPGTYWNYATGKWEAMFF
jgi:hypothetical protein